MYRKAVLIIFGILVVSSAIYALIDRKEVTTSSDQAYKAYRSGTAYLMKLYDKEALQEFERAVELDPQFAMALARMAALYYGFDRMEDYKQAKERTLARLDKIKDIEKIQIQLIFAGVERNIEDVDKFSKELTTKYPDNIESLRFLSSRYFDKKEVDKAIEVNLKLLTIDPNYALGYNMLGYLYYNKGEYDLALDYINKYTQIAPDQANPHDSHGEILLSLGRYDEALSEFQRADSIKSDLAFVIAHMGDTYMEKGMMRNAIGAYLKSRDLAANDRLRAEYDVRIANGYYYSDRVDESIKILKETIERMPDALSAQTFLGVYYVSTGSIEDALIQLGTVKALETKNRTESASDDSVATLRVTPSMLLQAQIASYKGQYDQAISIYSDIVTELSYPERFYYDHLLAGTYIRAGMPDSAVSLLTESLKHNPNYPLCLMSLAEAYKHQGNRKDQKEALIRLLSVLKDADEDLKIAERAESDLEKLNRLSL